MKSKNMSVLGILRYPENASFFRECEVCSGSFIESNPDVVWCIACKAFFRATVLDNKELTCGDKRECSVKPHSNFFCDFCHFQSCLDAGMTMDDQVYSFYRWSDPYPSMSDQINGRKSRERPYKRVGVEVPIEELEIDQSAITLQNWEPVINEEMFKAHWEYLSSGEGKYIADLYIRPNRIVLNLECTVRDQIEIAKITLKSLLKWANLISTFKELSIDEQAALLKKFLPFYYVMMTAYGNSKNTICSLKIGPDETSWEAATKEDEMVRPQPPSAERSETYCSRVYKEIILPMRDLEMTELEFVCMKAIIFLDWANKNLSPRWKETIKEKRNSFMNELDKTTLNGFSDANDARSRFTNIICIVMSLKSLVPRLVEEMSLNMLFGMDEIRTMLPEYIQENRSDQYTPSCTLPPFMGPAVEGSSSGM